MWLRIGGYGAIDCSISFAASLFFSNKYQLAYMFSETAVHAPDGHYISFINMTLAKTSESKTYGFFFNALGRFSTT